MSKICPSCKAENREQSKFCAGCGASLSELPPTAIFGQPPSAAQPSTEKMQSAEKMPSQAQPTAQPVAKKRRGFGWLFLILLLVAVVGVGAFFVRGGGLNSFRSGNSSSSPVVFDTRGEEAVVEEVETVVSLAQTPESEPVEEPTTQLEEEATLTPLPTTAVIPTATLPPTATKVPDIIPLVDANGLTVHREASAQTGIRVEIRYFDGSPKDRSGVGIFNQQTDVSNNPVYGDRIAADRTDATGAVFFPLDAGIYAIGLGDLVGGSWGNPFNYEVVRGQATVVSLTLGRLVIGVRNADEQPLPQKWTAVYLQTNDVNGNPIKGDRIANARTDNTGSVVYHIVPGIYAVEIGDLLGELWGTETNHAVATGETTNVLVTMGRLTVGVKNANDEPLRGHWVGVYFQGEDVEGNPAKRERIVNNRTDDRGLVQWDITAGTYAIEIGDVYGELWGNEFEHTVTSDEDTVVVLNLGRLSVGITDNNGNPAQNRWVTVYFQEQDVNGNPISGQRVFQNRTDNRGLVEWDMTAGSYVVEVQDVGTLLTVPIQAGKITKTNGITFEVIE